MATLAEVEAAARRIRESTNWDEFARVKLAALGWNSVPSLPSGVLSAPPPPERVPTKHFHDEVLRIARACDGDSAQLDACREMLERLDRGANRWRTGRIRRGRGNEEDFIRSERVAAPRQRTELNPGKDVRARVLESASKISDDPDWDFVSALPLSTLGWNVIPGISGLRLSSDRPTRDTTVGQMLDALLALANRHDSPPSVLNEVLKRVESLQRGSRNRRPRRSDEFAVHENTRRGSDEPRSIQHTLQSSPHGIAAPLGPSASDKELEPILGDESGYALSGANANSTRGGEDPLRHPQEVRHRNHGSDLPRTAGELMRASDATLKALFERDGRESPMMKVVTFTLGARMMARAGVLRNSFKSIISASLDIEISDDGPGAHRSLDDDEALLASLCDVSVAAMSATDFTNRLSREGIDVRVVSTARKTAKAWLKSMWRQVPTTVDIDTAASATLYFVGLYVEPWLEALGKAPSMVRPLSPKGQLPLAEACQKWVNRSSATAAVLRFMLGPNGNPATIDLDKAMGSENAKVEAYRHILPWEIERDGPPVWLGAWDGANVRTDDADGETQEGILHATLGPRLAVVQDPGASDTDTIFWAEVWWCDEGSRKASLRQFPSTLAEEGDKPFVMFQADGDWYAGNVPEVLREVVAECPDHHVDRDERDAMMAALAQLGSWLPEVIASPFLHRLKGVPTLQLALVEGPEPRVDVTLAHHFAELGETLRPWLAEPVTTRWRDGAAHFFMRDLGDEVKVLESLATELDIPARGPRFEGCVIGLDAARELLNRDFGTLRVEWTKESERPGRVGAGGFRVSVREASKLLTVSGDYEHLGRRIPLEELLAEVRHGRRFAWSATAGTWLEIAPEVGRVLERMALSVSKDARGRTSIAPWGVAAVSELGALDATVEMPASLPGFVPTVERIQAAFAVEVRLPEGLRTATLRPYQEQGFAWLLQTSHWAPGALLGDDMGLGKSLQALLLAARRASEGPTLIVAPKSLSANWQDEMRRHLPGVFRVRTMLDGGGEAALGRRPAAAGEVVVTTWNRIRTGAESLAGTRWRTVILDEVHVARNARTQIHAAVKALLAEQGPGCFVLGLSGTPVQNHVKELEAVFELLVPGYLKSAGVLARASDVSDADYRRVLAAAVRPFYLRRRKDDVAADLPPRFESPVTVTLSDDERRFYEEIRRGAVAKLEDAAGKEALHVFAALALLRQICLDARLTGRKFGIGAKTEAVIAQVSELVQEDRSCLVFSAFTKYLDLLEEAFKEAGLSVVRLDGQTSAKGRDEAVRKFQAGDAQVFLLGLKAGGEGLNLTRASEVLLVDPWWNRAAERQAMDRAHRIGQTRPVNVWRFIADDTIEEHIVAMADDKQEMVDDLVEGKQGARPMALAELRRLLTERGQGFDRE